MAFGGVSYMKVVNSRDDQVPTEGDFLAALLPLLCIPALLSLGCGFYKWLVNSYCFLLTEISEIGIYWWIHVKILFSHVNCFQER